MIPLLFLCLGAGGCQEPPAPPKKPALPSTPLRYPAGVVGLETFIQDIVSTAFDYDEVHMHHLYITMLMQPEECRRLFGARGERVCRLQNSFLQRVRHYALITANSIRQRNFRHVDISSVRDDPEHWTRCERVMLNYIPQDLPVLRAVVTSHPGGYGERFGPFVYLNNRWVTLGNACDALR